MRDKQSTSVTVLAAVLAISPGFAVPELSFSAADGADGGGSVDVDTMGEGSSEDDSCKDDEKEREAGGSATGSTLPVVRPPV